MNVAPFYYTLRFPSALIPTLLDQKTGKKFLEYFADNYRADLPPEITTLVNIIIRPAQQKLHFSYAVDDSSSRDTTNIVHISSGHQRTLPKDPLQYTASLIPLGFASVIEPLLAPQTARFMEHRMSQMPPSANPPLPIPYTRQRQRPQRSIKIPNLSLIYSVILILIFEYILRRIRRRQIVIPQKAPSLQTNKPSRIVRRRSTPTIIPPARQIPPSIQQSSSSSPSLTPKMKDSQSHQLSCNKITEVLRECLDYTPSDALVSTICRLKFTQTSQLVDMIRIAQQYISSRERQLDRILKDPAIVQRLRSRRISTGRIQFTGSFYGGSGDPAAPKVLSPLFTSADGILDQILEAVFPSYLTLPRHIKNQIRQIVTTWIHKRSYDLVSIGRFADLLPAQMSLVRPIRQYIGGYLLGTDQPLDMKQPALHTSPLHPEAFGGKSGRSSTTRRRTPPQQIVSIPLPQMHDTPMTPKTFVRIGTWNLQNLDGKPDTQISQSTKLQQKFRAITTNDILEPDILCFQEFPPNFDHVQSLGDVFRRIYPKWTLIVQGDAVHGNASKKNRLAIAFEQARFELVSWQPVRTLHAHPSSSSIASAEIPGVLTLESPRLSSHQYRQIQISQRHRQQAAVLTMSYAMGIVLCDKKDHHFWLIINVHFLRPQPPKTSIGLDKGLTQIDEIIQSWEDYRRLHLPDSVSQTVVVGDFNQTYSAVRRRLPDPTIFMSFDTEYYGQGGVHQQHQERQRQQGRSSTSKNIDGVLIFPPSNPLWMSILLSIHTHEFPPLSDHPFKIFEIQQSPASSRHDKSLE